jgi:hypothetical protein
MANVKNQGEGWGLAIEQNYGIKPLLIINIYTENAKFYEEGRASTNDNVQCVARRKV